MPEARQAQPFDLDLWKQWEGQSVATGFVPDLVLERCIGGSSRGAVFATQFAGRPAAVKLLTGTKASSAAYVAEWEKAARLSHPALVQTLAYGETDLGDTPAAYLVMERADDNLGEILVERPLTPAETREMLSPVLGALQYLEAQGFSHGRLKPANILAFGDQVKISSDGLIAAKDPATDCRAVGVLSRDVLGGGEVLPEPFGEIVQGCLMADPVARWGLARIEQRLHGSEKSPEKSKEKPLAQAKPIIVEAKPVIPPPTVKQRNAAKRQAGPPVNAQAVKPRPAQNSQTEPGKSHAARWALGGIAAAGLVVYALWPTALPPAIVSQGFSPASSAPASQPAVGPSSEVAPAASVLPPTPSLTPASVTNKKNKNKDQAKPAAGVTQPEKVVDKPSAKDVRREEKAKREERARQDEQAKQEQDQIKQEEKAPQANVVASQDVAPPAPSADGITRVMPDISRQALGTINGKVRINVRVHVDAAGNVSQATLQTPSSSKYFVQRVLPAAQSSRFPPGSEGDWVLHYELVRTQMRVSPEKIN